MVDIGAVVAGGVGIGVVILAVMTLIQVVVVLPVEAARWKVGAVLVSSVAMGGVGIVVAYRAATGGALTVGLLGVAVLAAVVTTLFAEDVRPEGRSAD